MSISRPSAGFPAGSPQYRRILVTLSLGGLANFAMIYFVQPLLPQLGRTFRVSDGATGAALSSATLAMMIGLLLAGPLADRIGRVRVMSGSMVVAGVFTVACAWAPSWEWLLVFRGASGLALAGLPVIALAYLRDHVDDAAHPRANAVYIAGTAMGGALGRLLPGPLSGWGGWETAAYVLGVFSVVIGVAVVIALPLDRPGRGRQHGGVPAAFTVLRNAQVALLCLLGFILMAVFVGAYNAIALRLEAEPFELGAQSAWVYLAYPASILAPGVFRRLSDRWGRVSVVIMGLLVMGAALCVTAPPSVITVLVGLGLLTFAFMGTHSMISGWVVDRAHHLRLDTARASSAYLVLYYAGSTVSGTLATHLWSWWGWPGVLVWCGGLVVVGLVCAVTVLRLERSDPS